MTNNCRKNGQTTWTYNQAAVASRLSGLSVATGDESYLTEAKISLDAALDHLTVDGILKESCDNAGSAGTPCNNNQKSFKVYVHYSSTSCHTGFRVPNVYIRDFAQGIYIKHLQYYLDNAPLGVSKYSSALGKYYSGVYSNAT